MRVPVEWLHRYCRPELTLAELASRLALTGTEVDRFGHHGVGALEHFVVGKVLAAGPHPDADRLSVCRVAVAPGEEAQIVCGAPNVATGQTVAVARPGAVMPDGTRLKKARLRGQPSDGMILAEDELGIGSDHAGIMVLDDALGAGTPLADVLPLGTDVLELEITPNRPDCLGVYGVAREVQAATGAPLADPPWSTDPGSADGDVGVEVAIEASDLCPRFAARRFDDVTIGPSPAWLKARLMAAGQRPISNVVDVTNYVMLLAGQPLHAFDAGRIAGSHLVVRRAGDGEQLVTLDGQTRVLDPEVCLIADADGPTSIAGVMGGERSEVAPDTTSVLMEAATWIGPNIHATALKLGLRSEASSRFEKGLAPEQALEGLIVATQLMLELTGATLVPGTVDVGEASPPPAPQVIRLRDSRVRALLGVDVARSESRGHLQRLGFDVDERADGLDVAVPGFRRLDVTREADLVEEVARLHGFDDAALPATLPARRGAAGILTAHQRLRRRAEDVLVGRGLHEVVGWSFEAPGRDDELRLAPDDSRRRRVVLANPMSEDQSVMRTTLLGSLLDAARRNAARGQGVPAIFESGGVYLATDDRLPAEHRSLGALVGGDVFAAKGLLEAVLGVLRVNATFAAAPEPFLHPGRSAAVRLGDVALGWVGDVHPLVARTWDLEDVAAFEVDLDALLDAATIVPGYEDLTSFPEVREDLAVVVDADVPAATVLHTVRGAGGKLLADALIFDVYRGAQVADGRVSLALRLAFRAPDRTLTADEVAPVREKIVARLAEELGGELRG